MRSWLWSDASTPFRLKCRGSCVWPHSPLLPQSHQKTPRYCWRTSFHAVQPRWLRWILQVLVSSTTVYVRHNVRRFGVGQQYPPVMWIGGVVADNPGPALYRNPMQLQCAIKGMVPQRRRPPKIAQERAFVVQFYADTGLGPTHLAGRVKHVVLGQVGHFRSLATVLSFITRVLVETGTAGETEA
jgi:hypothetical protein